MLNSRVIITAMKLSEATIFMFKVFYILHLMHELNFADVLRRSTFGYANILTQE